MENKYISVPVRLTEKQYHQLRNEAHEGFRSMAEIIRELVEKHYEKNQKS